MTLPVTLLDREFQKFEEINGTPHVRTSGTAQFTGLSTAGRITEVTLNSSTWTALPSSALSGRNGLGIQNRSGTEIKINYDNSVPTYTGVTIINGAERFYDITDSIIVYAKSASGTPTIVVEEIA
jgi:hypothetical protein